MKTKSRLFIALGVFFALVVGFLIGLSVDYPKVGDNDVAGTITKINNYRNSQLMKSDIQIQNELISDTAKLKSIQKLLNYYYLSAIKMSVDVQLTLKETNSIESFKSIYQDKISKLENYGKFLSSARTDLLLAISACNKPGESDSQVLKELLNQANNVIAQINFKNRIVLEFIDNLAAFVKKNNSVIFEDLLKAHDLLVLNELNIALLTNDKTLLSALDKKEFLGNVKNLKSYENGRMSKIIIQDVESLGALMDSEKLGYWDSEKLGMFDQEKLGQALLLDSEKLGFLDAEILNMQALDAEKLNGAQMDAEKLGLVNDSEVLNIIKIE